MYFFTLFCIVLVMVSVLHDLKIQAKFFFLIRPWNRLRWRGPWGPWSPTGRVWGAKKTRLLTGAGSGFLGRPAGRVRTLRNPVRTRPVAIPNLYRFILKKKKNFFFFNLYHFLIFLTKKKKKKKHRVIIFSLYHTLFIYFFNF